MSIRTVLAPFAGAEDSAAVRSALAVASHLGARVTGLYVEPPERSLPAAARAPAMAGPGGGSFGMAGLRAELSNLPDPITEMTRQRDQAAESAKSAFLALCETAGVPFRPDASVNAAAPTLPSATFIRESGDAARIVARLAQVNDLVVMEGMAVAPKEFPARNAIKAALLQSGRPVLLAPIHTPEQLGGRVLIAWSDTPQCWHALSVALPFLMRAKEVVLFHAGKDRAEQLAEKRAAEYLAWHGVDAEVLQRPPGPGGVASNLMSECNNRQTGLMVMGAFSHSVLRENLFGGVTRTIVSNVAATPVLMMH